MNVEEMARPKSFSVDDAVEVVMELYLQRGIGVSMQEVGEVLNLSRSSIYSTWGSKAGLLVAVLKRYGRSRVPGLNEVRTASAPRAALVGMFEQAPAVEREPCLLINTLVDLKPGDSDSEVGRLVKTAVQELEKSLAGAIRRGQDDGEIAPDIDADRTGPVLLALYLGLYVLIRSGRAGKPVLRAVVGQVEAMLPEPARP